MAGPQEDSVRLRKTREDSVRLGKIREGSVRLGKTREDSVGLGKTPEGAAGGPLTALACASLRVSGWIYLGTLPTIRLGETQWSSRSSRGLAPLGVGDSGRKR